MEVDEIVTAIRTGRLSTQDLVRINYALAQRSTNTTSVLGQYGEELVAAAYRGTRSCGVPKPRPWLKACADECPTPGRCSRPGRPRGSPVAVGSCPGAGDVSCNARRNDPGRHAGAAR
jgi:hypothetical protein